MKHKIISAIIGAALALSLAACSAGGTASAATAATSSSGSSDSTLLSASAETLPTGSDSIDTSDMFSTRDIEVGYSDYVTVTLADGATTADGTGVTVNGNTITITAEGTYLFKGTLADGQIVVDAPDDAKVQIVLDGANITNDNSAAIYVKAADKVFITTAQGSENTLSVTGDYVQTDDNNVDAAVFSKSDLTLNGAGTLTISSAKGHGVVSKDDLAVTSGTYDITASASGLNANNSVRIAGGTFTITSGTDAVHSENADDSSLGFIYVKDGTFTITAGTDGFDASAYLMIDGGTFKVTTGGGSQNASTSDSWGQWGSNSSGSAEDTASAKALKATGDLVINGGTFTIDSSDDSVHSNANVYVNGGTLTISSGDDGIHANTAVYISDGTIDISKSYEGVEGQSISIAGGSTSLIASDDGLNASGGNDQSSTSGRNGQNDFTADADAFIDISGGTVNVNAGGDGIDSNGSLKVSGGETYVSGPTSSGNGALDYNGDAVISGGIVIAAGSTGMAQNFSTTSTQGSMLVTLDSSETGAITLKDSSGSVVAQFTPDKEYQSVVISAPGITNGSTYTLTAGGETKTVEMTSLIYGSDSGSSGRGGFGKTR